MGSSEAIAELSGAGEIIPALAQEASRPGFCASNTATRIPSSASSNAMEAPMRRRPATTGAECFMDLFYGNARQEQAMGEYDQGLGENSFDSTSAFLAWVRARCQSFSFIASRAL